VHVVAGRDDRFFPLELQQRVARERLGVEPVVVPGGHLAALSHPDELAAVIARCL
jgi:pimeloyl-ACP methyl ester carboxylesterase